MRLKSLVLWDMRFQLKYGFYLLYAILTVLYLLALSALPGAWREKAAWILILSDPAAMGLFFMGAMVLLEKSQRVPWALAVSPIRPIEYIAAKVISLLCIALIVAAALTVGISTPSLPLIIAGTALASIIFTLLGIIVATKITSLNQFLLWTVPIECLGFVPAILHLFGLTPAMLRFYPINLCIDMIGGKSPEAGQIFIAVMLIVILGLIARKGVIDMWNSMGGLKL